MTVRFNYLAPMLQTRKMTETIAFYTQILGFSVAGLAGGNDPYWCSLERDGVRIMFMTNDHVGEPRLSGTLYLNMTGVLAHHEAIKNSVEVLWGPEDFDYGMREFAIRENNGYTISFGEPIEGIDEKHKGEQA